MNDTHHKFPSVYISFITDVNQVSVVKLWKYEQLMWQKIPICMTENVFTELARTTNIPPLNNFI